MNARALPILVLVCGCSDLLPDAPNALTIEPKVGRVDQPTRVVIGGTFRTASVRVDYRNTAQSTVSETMTVRLDETALVDIRVVDPTDEPLCPSDQPSCVEATVPAGMPIGMHSLTVVDPDGASTTVTDAFRILTPAERVVTLRIAAIDPQIAGVAFEVVATALDDAEEIVTDFDGPATVEDVDGRSVGAAAFVAGRLVTSVVRQVSRPDDRLRVVSAGVAQDSNRFVVGAGPAARLAATGPTTIDAGVCSPAFTIVPQDEFGNAVTNEGAVTLTVSGVGGQIFADAACTAATDAVTLADGAAAADVYALATRVGPFELRVESAELGAAAAPSTIVAGAPTRLSLVATDANTRAGVCSAPFRANTFDAFGNDAPVASATTLTLTSSMSGSFYADVACANPVGSVDIAALEREATFYFIATSTGAGEVRASAAQLGSATATITVTPGPAAKLRFTTAARVVDAGYCVSLSVERLDDFGHPVDDEPLDVAAAASSTNVAFYADAACTVPTTVATFATGSSVATVYVRSLRVGEYDLTIGTVDPSSVTQTFTVGFGSPQRLALTQVPLAPQAGACVGPWTVERRDGFDNPSPDSTTQTQVDLSASPANVDFFTDAACTVAIANIDIALGAATADFYAIARSAGDADVAADAFGLAGTSRTVTFSSGPAARLALVTPGSVEAGACAAATVEQHDVTNAPVASALDRTVSLEPTMPAGFSVFSDAACTTPITQVTITAGTTQTMFFVRGQIAGAGSLAASSTGLTPDTSPITITPGAPDRLVVITPARTVIAGACSPVVQVEVRDDATNPVPMASGGTVNLTLAPASGTWSFYDDAACTNAVNSVAIAAGQARTSFYFTETTAGSATFDAALAGATSASQLATVQPDVPFELRFDSAAQSVRINDCSSAAVVSSRDQFGNTSAPSGNLTISLGTAAAGVTFYTDSTCTNASASATLVGGSTNFTFYFAGTNEGSATLTADHNSYTVAASQVTTFTSCGDGSVDVGETCDDGDTTAGDGCSATCTVEAGWVCVLEPSSCFAEASVAVTDDSGPSCPGLGAGTDTDPFCTIGDAVTSGQLTIVVRPGNYPETVLLTNLPLTILADDGAVVAPTINAALDIGGTANVSIVGLAVRGGTGEIVDIYGSATVVLQDVEIGPGPDIGLHTRGTSQVTLHQSYVHDTGDVAFLAIGLGGYHVANTLFVGGGDHAVDLRGIDVGSAFVNNTIVGHVGEGVRCANADVLTNIIVWNNAGGDVEASCAPQYSNLQAAHTNLTNFFTDPLFALDGTYRLQPTSPCIDAGHPSGIPPAPNIDIDGDARPMGLGIDIGADEAG